MEWPHSLRALRYRELRFFFAAHMISLVGSFVHVTAMSWLAYRLTQSAGWLGLVGFLGQAPIFFLSVYAGALADRRPRRQIVMVAQALAAVQANALALLTWFDLIQPWHLL